MSEIIIYVTAPDAQEAKKIAKILLEDRLVACANILPPHQSLYRWEGAVQDETEVVMILKSRADLFDKIEEKIKMHHSYDVPCIVSWPVGQGHGPFLEWVRAEVNG